MHNYLKYDEQTISDFSDENIEEMYARGFLMTRVNKGQMYQTKSIRINLASFELTSENRRILRKTENLNLIIQNLPFDNSNYDWHIHKIGKDFYTQKFGDDTFSANKIKELVTTEHNFNLLLQYSFGLENNQPLIDNQITESIDSVSDKESALPSLDAKHNEKTQSPELIPVAIVKEVSDDNVGYCIAVQTANLFHYCYPFYKLDIDYANLGMGMMLKAILWAKENGKKYVYLGSMSRESDKYKMQFNGLEVWNNESSDWEQIQI